MAAMVSDGSSYAEISVGTDFVDAALLSRDKREPASRGLLSIGGDARRQPWRSTMSQQDTERFFREVSRRDGRRLTFFQSQAV